MKAFKVRKKITIKAAPPAVWDALTNPDKTKEYFFHCKVYSDWKPGSTITFRGKVFFFKKIELKGRIEKIVPEKLLQYSLKNGGKDESSRSMVTDKLTFANGKTTLSVTDDVGQGTGAEKRYKRSEKGWDKVLKGLKELVESR